MNKFLRKIAVAMIGFAMAVGVGIASGNETKADRVEATDVTIKNTTYEQVYFTGFEDAPTGQTYNSTQTYTAAQTNSVAWSVYYGTVSTSDVLTGSNSMHMRWYASATDKYPHAETTSAVDDVKAFKFNYAVSNINVDFKVQYSTNGSSWNDIETVGTTSTGKTEYSHVFDSSISKFYFKVLVCLGTAPGSGNYKFRIDDVYFGKEKSSSDTTTALSVSGCSDARYDSVENTWTGYTTSTLDVSSFTIACTSTKTPGYSFQGIGYMNNQTFVARSSSFTSGHPTVSDTRLCWKATYPQTAGQSNYLYLYVILSVSEDSVQSIAITGSMTKKTYNQGDSWDPAGFTVNAYYASAPSTPVDVTSNNDLEWSYSPPTTASTSTTSVTCTASFGGKTATSSAQAVTINEKTNLGGIVNGEKYFIIATYSDSEYYLKSFSSTSAVGDSAAAWPGDSNMPATDDDAWTFTATSTDDCWSVTNNDGDTLYSIVDNNGLRCGTSDHVWQLAEVNNALKMYNTAHVGAKGMYLTLYQGTNWRTYNSTAGQQEINSTIRFVKYVEPVTLDSLTVIGSTTTFTAGDYFSLGSPTITATYSTGAESITANDSGLSFKLGGTSITTSTRLTISDNGKSLVVRYTDSEDRYADATGYAITVNPKAVQSVTLDKASATIAKSGTVDLTATVTDEYAIQTIKWTTSSSSIATLSSATSTSGNHITVTGSSSNAGNATITAYVDENNNGSLDNGEKSATCIVTVSGDPVLNMYDESSTLVTSGEIDKFTGDSNFYLNVVAQNFVGGITYTWSSSNTSAISIHEEADNMCEFIVAGAGDTTISCQAVGATSGNLTVSTTIHVAVPAVTSLTWNATNISAYSNQSLTSTIVNGWTVSYEKDNGDSGTVSFGTYDLYLGSEKITSLPRVWSTLDDEKTLHVEYGGVSTSTVSVQITEHLNAISYSSWSLVTDISDLSAGDVVIIANADKGKAMSSTALKAGETLETTAVTITNGEVVSEIPSATARFTLGGNSSDGWSFKCGDNYLYFSTTNNNRTMDLKSESSSYDIAIDGETGDAIVGGTMRIVLNTNNSPNRWSSYNTTTETSSMQFPEIYKASNSNIADTNANAQRALLGFVSTFNTTMECDGDYGNTENVASKWSSLSSTFTSTMNGLSESDKIVFKRLVSSASSVEDGDSLQDFLARYDYIVKKYKLKDSDFLHTAADRGYVYTRISTPSIIQNNAGTATTIILISMVSLTVIGGYFFLRKRRHI